MNGLGSCRHVFDWSFWLMCRLAETQWSTSVKAVQAQVKLCFASRSAERRKPTGNQQEFTWKLLGYCLCAIYYWEIRNVGMVLWVDNRTSDFWFWCTKKIKKCFFSHRNSFNEEADLLTLLHKGSFPTTWGHHGNHFSFCLSSVAFQVRNFKVFFFLFV